MSELSEKIFPIATGAPYFFYVRFKQKKKVFFIGFYF